MLTFEPWKVGSILAVLVFGVLFAIPNFFSRETVENWPDFVPSSQINLGLDLQGGAHLLLEVQVDGVVQERLEGLLDEVRSALRSDRGGQRESIRRTGLRISGEDSVSVRITNSEQVSDAVTRLGELGGTVTLNLLGSMVKDTVVEVMEDQRIEIRLTPEAVQDIKTKAVSQSIEVVRRRIDELGTREPSIQRQGTDRIIVQVPGAGDPQRILDLLGKTAKMAFHLVDTSVTIQEALDGRVPPGSMLLPSDEINEPFVLVRRNAPVTGESLVGAAQGFDQQTNQAIVTFRFDSGGARRFAELSRENVGRRFAIVLDNRVISAPVIREAILGGSGQISGNFTVQSANDLAILLRAGALPAELQPLEQRTVGPDLGADSIRAGKIAAMIGFSGVIVFIIVSYGLFGLFANAALILNLLLVAGVLSLLGATLTLPGIAGIVLTIGMAVDANVLIFERIREEIKAGKSPINSIEAGYSRALGTILDANITTFLAAAVLFQLGSGPVKGFAVTLAIGIVTSVFTAFTVTRLMVVTWLRKKRPEVLPI